MSRSERRAAKSPAPSRATWYAASASDHVPITEKSVKEVAVALDPAIEQVKTGEEPDGYPTKADADKVAQDLAEMIKAKKGGVITLKVMPKGGGVKLSLLDDETVA